MTGKSVVTDVWGAMIGKDTRMSYLDLDQLKQEVNIASMTNKMVNICGEMSAKYVEMDRFKKLVTGDGITCRGLYKDPFQYHCELMFIFAANDMPKHSESTNAVSRRFAVLPFDNEVPESERESGFSDILINEELDGVTKWAVDTFWQEMARDRMKSVLSDADTPQGKKLRDEIETGESSVKEMLKDTDAVRITDKPYNNCEEIFTYYHYVWCKNKGRNRPASDRIFTRYAKGMGVDKSNQLPIYTIKDSTGISFAYVKRTTQQRAYYYPGPSNHWVSLTEEARKDLVAYEIRTRTFNK